MSARRVTFAAKPHDPPDKRHELLHACLDELVACYITSTHGRPSETTVMDLLKWSYSVAQDPSGCRLHREGGPACEPGSTPSDGMDPDAIVATANTLHCGRWEGGDW